MEQKATKIFQGGTVITMDAAHTVTEAVALKGNKILAVGMEKDIKNLVGPETEIVDLKGAVLLPGFYDPHGHIEMYADALAGVNLNSPPIGNIKNMDELIEAVKKHAEKVPEGGWIYGWGYDDTRLADMRHPLRYDLDRVSTEKPICLKHISGHLCALNSKALELAGYTKDTPNPEGGVLQRDPVTGELNGVIEENALIILTKVMAGPTDDEKMDLMVQAGRIYASQGVTTASEHAAFHIKNIEHIRRSVAEGTYPIRISIAPIYTLINELGSFEELKNYIQEIQEETDQINFAGIKWLQDGSIQGYTAYLSQPYFVPYKGDENYRGYPTNTREKLMEIIKDIHINGEQVVLHTNGDEAIDDVLDAIAAAQGVVPRKEPRHILIHCQTVREDQLDRMKELGVHPNFFIPHIYYWGERHKNIFLGPERASRINPVASALERGLIPTIHCDTPIVPQTPLLAIGTAVTRQTYEGSILGPGQRISVWDALKTYTINAAWQFSEDKFKGSIEAGKLADLVILEENPMLVDPMHIKDIRVLETIVGSETVYKG